MSKKRVWTDDQKNAIEARGGGLLVSAAAGSGKTAVLVERVIRRVCDKADGCPIDRLLVVTFTNAAAAEMRERIALALEKELAAHPNDAYLLRQQMLLPSAEICTIDSFCSSLVKAHFHEANISPDFRVLSNAESDALREKTLQDCLQALYASENPALDFLTGLLTQGSNDRALRETLLNLYKSAQAYPDPERWLRNIPSAYDASIAVQDTIWGKAVLAEVKRCAEGCRSVLEHAVKQVQTEPELADICALVISADFAYLDRLEKALKKNDWDLVMETLASYVPDKMPTTPKAFQSHPAKVLFHTTRNENTKRLRDLMKLFPANSKQHRADMTVMQPAIQLLVDTVLHFSDLLMEAKRAENAYDFSDISHFALRLLVRLDEKSGTVVRTPLAESLRAQYCEILLDEYQDTNAEQEFLFTALSADESNLFCVGDVKQSIYGFRLAMPEIFLRRRAAACAYDGAHFPARITLGSNFRSRKTVCEAVNSLFAEIMTEKSCGIEYGETEKLYPGAEYPGEDPAVELHILEKNALDDPAFSAEAVHVAAYIQKLVEENTQVSDGKGGMRDIRYSDICILMRSLSDSEAYVRALEAYGIPAYSQKNGGFFQMREIRTMLSLLQALDNPYADVPLCAALYSPIWGFTPDELAQIKMTADKLPFYQKLLLAGTKKCERFLADFDRLHALATVLTPSALLQTIYEETGYFSLVGAMPGGENRKRNLLLLQQFAQEYDAYGKTSLSSFLRYLDRLRASVHSVESPSGVSEFADVVRIISIHKSKGLEFPVVILAKCGASFNENEYKKPVVLHPDLLLGCCVYDAAGERTYSCLPYEAVRHVKRADGRAEELRVLYVAMTRAKERLVLVGSAPPRMKLSNFLAACAHAAQSGEPLPASYVRGSSTYLSWIVAAWILHPAAAALRALCDCKTQKAEAAFRLKVEYVDKIDPPSLTDTENSGCCSGTDQALLEEIRLRLAYQYPYAALLSCPAKISASGLNAREEALEHIAQARPAFLGEGGMTPAMRGTATHAFVQFCDFALTSADLETEIKRLCAVGKITQAQAEILDRAALKTFFASPLFERMQQAQAIYREQKFTTFLPANDMLDTPKDVYDKESVLLQGVMDCVFLQNDRLVLVDYKTDRVRTPQALAQRYQTQMRVYAKAAAELFSRPVDEVYLYSFALGEAVAVNI